MKKLMMAVTVVAMMAVSVFSVAAAEVDEDFVSNMDEATFIELRTAQLDAALADETIDQDQYTALLDHITDVAGQDSFGQGSAYGQNGQVNEECVLGEDGQLGVFKNDNAGMKNGNGNGVGQMVQDGSNAGQGNRRGGQDKGLANGLQNGNNLGQGARGQANNGDCVISE